MGLIRRKLKHDTATLNWYQKAAALLAKPLDEFDDKVNRGILGLCGESGELADYWKKVKYQDHPYDLLAVLLELGDALWYISVLADDLGVSLQEVAVANINKLRKRYPDGFNSEQSVHRGL